MILNRFSEPARNHAAQYTYPDGFNCKGNCIFVELINFDFNRSIRGIVGPFTVLKYLGIVNSINENYPILPEFLEVRYIMYINDNNGLDTPEKVKKLFDTTSIS